MMMRQPLIDPKYFLTRREKLRPMFEDAALVLVANTQQPRSYDVHYPFRQDSDFFYMTGFDEPDAIFVFRPGQNPESVLFVRDRNPERETWDGFRFGPALTKDLFLVDEAYPLSELAERLPNLLHKTSRIYYPLDRKLSQEYSFLDALQKERGLRRRIFDKLLPIFDPMDVLGPERLEKEDWEIELIKKACQISSQAHIDVMKSLTPGATEHSILAKLIGSFLAQGAQREAYGSIVATGSNAVSLHHPFQEATCQDGECLLIDAGCEYNYYTSDITRTTPVNGKFSPAQKDLYQGILSVQKILIDSVHAGKTMTAIQDHCNEGLAQVMLDLKLLQGSLSEILESKAFRKYCPHSFGHWMGLDVHDRSPYVKGGTSIRLRPGMVFTIEPGIYISPHDEKAPQEMRGLGIRIEDDILVTTDSREILTPVPKEVDEIEALMAKG